MAVNESFDDFLIGQTRDFITKYQNSWSLIIVANIYIWIKILKIPVKTRSQRLSGINKNNVYTFNLYVLKHDLSKE